MENIVLIETKTPYTDAVRRAESETGYKLALHEITETFMYSARKCNLIGKGIDYLPILFECELKSYIASVYITTVGMMNMINKSKKTEEQKCAKNAE